MPPLSMPEKAKREVTVKKRNSIETRRSGERDSQVRAPEVFAPVVLDFHLLSYRSEDSSTMLDGTHPNKTQLRHFRLTPYAVLQILRAASFWPNKVRFTSRYISYIRKTPTTRVLLEFSSHAEASEVVSTFDRVRVELMSPIYKQYGGTNGSPTSSSHQHHCKDDNSRVASVGKGNFGKEGAASSPSSSEISIKMGVQSCEARFFVRGFVVSSGQFPAWLDENGQVRAMRNSDVFLELNPKKELIKGMLGPCFPAAWNLWRASATSQNEKKDRCTADSNRNHVIDEKKEPNAFPSVPSSRRRSSVELLGSPITQPYQKEIQRGESTKLEKNREDLIDRKVEVRPQWYRSRSPSLGDAKSDGRSSRNSDSYRHRHRHRHHHHHHREHRRQRERSLSNSSQALDDVVRREREHSTPSHAHEGEKDLRSNNANQITHTPDLLTPASMPPPSLCYDSLGPLPFGWRPVFSVEYQQTYYVYRHPYTGAETTTWDRPELPPVPF